MTIKTTNSKTTVAIMRNDMMFFTTSYWNLFIEYTVDVIVAVAVVVVVAFFRSNLKSVSRIWAS